MWAICCSLVSAFSMVAISAHTISIILITGVAASNLLDNLLVLVLDRAFKYFLGGFAYPVDVSLLFRWLSINFRGLLNLLVILNALYNRVEYFEYV